MVDNWILFHRTLCTSRILHHTYIPTASKKPLYPVITTLSRCPPVYLFLRENCLFLREMAAGEMSNISGHLFAKNRYILKKTRDLWARHRSTVDIFWRGFYCNRWQPTRISNPDIGHTCSTHAAHSRLAGPADGRGTTCETGSASESLAVPARTRHAHHHNTRRPPWTATKPNQSTQYHKSKTKTT